MNKSVLAEPTMTERESATTAVACPRCGAQPNQLCISLAIRPGEALRTSCHPQRHRALKESQQRYEETNNG